MPETHLFHANCICLSGQGILITGPSGSGKTQTSLAVYRRATSSQVSCKLISDDQTLLQVGREPSKLMATCPTEIQGKIEIFGYGIIEDPSIFIDRADVTLVANLVDRKDVGRMAPVEKHNVCGVHLPQLLLPMGNPELSATAIIAAICGHVRL